MGFRLSGPPLARPQADEILSGPTCLGSVQVPPSGVPIALMADHQTTGGYPRIAEIASADVARLAQLAPGGKVHFARCSLEIAAELRHHAQRACRPRCAALPGSTGRANEATIDLNCDMGESYGAWKMGADAEVMPHITSANIACGFHGGDPATIRKTVRLALEHGVAIGAHPSLPDLQGFGRRPMKISPQEMYDLVVYQAGAVEAFARAAGARLHHVKCHGALYNMAANDEALSEAMVRAAKDLGGVDALRLVEKHEL